MVARKDADAKAEEVKAEDKAADDAAKKDDDKKDDGVTLTVADPESELPQFDKTGANPEPGKGPEGREAPTKEEKSEFLRNVVVPEVTSVNPEPYTVEEINHRFNHVPPAGAVERKITIQGVTDRNDA